MGSSGRQKLPYRLHLEQWLLVGVFALPTAGIVPFDTVGMTMSYGGTATATHGGASPKAGPLSGFGGGPAPPAGPSLDLAGFGPGAFPGSTLTTASPGAAGFVDSAGYLDPASAADFGGVATPPFAAAPMDIMGWDFTITGPVSSTVTFTPGPGLDGFGFPALGGGTLTFFDTESASGFSPATFGGITITIVPEPSVPLLLGVAGLFGIAVRRRRN